MPRRSFLADLPPDLRDALNARLIEKGFADYDGFAEWLNDELAARELELRVSRSAIARHGQAFEEKVEAIRVATQQAQALAEAAGDDEGAMNDALIRLVQTHWFEVLRDMDNPKDMNKVSLAISRLTRASVNQKKWMAEMREKLEKAKENIRQKGRRGGVSDETLAAIEQELNIL